MGNKESYIFEDIFKRYKQKVYRLALGISRNERDAEDIMQNTFVKIMEHLSGFRGDSQLSTWIYRITYNEALMLLRKRYRSFRLSNYVADFSRKNPSGLSVNWPKLPDEILLEEELKQRIEFAIRHMPIKYRMALVLHHMEDLPVKEAAEIMGLKINSLKTRLHRAYLLLKAEMDEYSKDRFPESTQEPKQCTRITKFIYDYARGSLGLRQKTAFDRHIQDCPECTLFLDAYLKAIRISSSLQCQDISPVFQKKVLSFLEN